MILVAHVSCLAHRFASEYRAAEASETSRSCGLPTRERWGQTSHSILRGAVSNQ